MTLKDIHIERGLDPGGGHWDRLDTSRYEIVKLCGEKGIALFSFLLASSTIIPGKSDIALFELQSLHDLASQLGWSPDTVKRYVAVFRAVNLVLHHHDHRQEVKLHLPLGPYTPLTNFTALDELIGKRIKQRQLALKVKTRYVIRFGDPTQAHSDELRTKFQKLSTILDSERLEPLKRQRLQMQIADLFTQLIGNAGYSSVGDSNQILDDLEATPERGLPGQGDSDNVQGILGHLKIPTQAKMTTGQGDLEQSQGDPLGQSSTSSPPNLQRGGDPNQQQGDLEQRNSSPLVHQSERQGDLEEQQGDPIPSSITNSRAASSIQETEQGDLNNQQGDLLPTSQAQQPLKTDTMGDSKQKSQLEKGDLNGQTATNVDAKAPYTYNVTYLINNIKGDSVIRRHIAKFMASVLEKNEYENGYPTFSKYLKAFNVYSPEVIGRAFLATMFLLHRKNWQTNPGATFTNQCKILSGKMPLAHYTLDDVEEWLQMWGNLPYPELIIAIAVPVPAQLPPEPALLVTNPRQGSNQSKVTTLPERSFNYGGNKKRTYGMHYTGGRLSGSKSFNNFGSLTPPPPQEKS